LQAEGFRVREQARFSKELAVASSIGLFPPYREPADAGFLVRGGERPRHFSLDPTGSWLVVGNDRSNRLVLFRVDPASGGLKEAASLDFPAPWCQVFVPGGKQGTSGFE
jgi:hypothetical protein